MPTVGCNAPPAGSVGTPYTHTFSSTGGPSLFFTISSGSLPPGVFLDPATGVVSGTPTTAGVYPFGVSVQAGQFAVAQDVRPFEIVMTSPDGNAPWTLQTTTLTKNGIAVAFGNDTYVVGTDLTSETEQIATSPDAATWTKRSTPANGKHIIDIIFGGGQFVSTFTSNTTPIMTSPDGAIWTAHSVPTPLPGGGRWQKLAYSPDLGLYVAVSANGFIMTSPDAVTWTDRGAPITFSDVACIAWGSGLFVALGGVEGSGIHLNTSPNGIAWTTQSDPAGNAHRYEGLFFGGGKFVAVSPNGFAAYSANGLSWTQSTGVPSDTWQGVSFGAGVYAACANGSGDTSAVMTSPTGAAWTAQTTPAVDSCQSICWGAVGSKGTVSCSITIGSGVSFRNFWDNGMAPGVGNMFN